MIEAFEGPNNCVGATAVAVDVFERLEIGAGPMSVQAKLVAPGRELTIGFSGAVLPEGDQDLHLICAIADGSLLDLSLDQANAFDGFKANSLFIESRFVSKEFWKVGGTTNSGIGDSTVTYVNHQDSRAFESSSHWRDRGLRSAIVERVVASLNPLRVLYVESPT